jgi:hypothetical protein
VKFDEQCFFRDGVSKSAVMSAFDPERPFQL